MRFETTPEQDAKIEAWAAALDAQVQAKQVAECEHCRDSTKLCHLHSSGPYYGAIGGGLRLMFTPTGIGIGVRARHSATGEELDVTDYDAW